MNIALEPLGAFFKQNGNRILTWIDDITVRSWDIAIDPDSHIDQIKLQVSAITRISYDTITNTVKVLPPVPLISCGMCPGICYL